MKFGLIVHDLDEQEIAEVLQKLAGHTVVNLQTGEQLPTVPKVAPKIQPGEGVDADGLPWDERIHAGSKTKTSKGVWKRKKGVQDIEFDTVVEELKVAAPQALAIPSNVPPMPSPSDTIAQPSPQAPIAPSAPVAPAAPPPPPAAPSAPSTPAAAIERNFAGLMQHMSNLFAAQKITPQYMTELVGKINEGCKSNIVALTDIADNKDLVEYAWQWVDFDGHGVAA